MSRICGIVDFEGKPFDVSSLGSMALGEDPMSDGRRGSLSRSIGFLHSSLDGREGRVRQPVASPDGRRFIIADSRIDNRHELRSLLDDQLWSDEPGDEELILAAYSKWHRRCTEHLLGDFAFAIWDDRRRHLFCARDPLGIKPFHFAQFGPLTMFASEVRQLLLHPRVPWDLDEVALGLFLCGQWKDQRRTPFRHIRALSPAHAVTFRMGGSTAERFWSVDPEARIELGSVEEYRSCFLEIFKHAVADRSSTGSKTVGVAMSGGLDSCSVAAVAQEQRSSRSLPPVVAGSYVFDQLRECDERFYIDAMVDELELGRVEVELESYGILDGRMVEPEPAESPFIHFDLALHDLLKGLREVGAGVVLTGHGGDELILGSRLVYADRLKRGEIGALLEIVEESRAAGRNPLRSLYSLVLAPFLPEYLDRAIRRRERLPLLPPWLHRDFSRRSDLEASCEPRLEKTFSDRSRQKIYENLIEWAAYGPNVYWYHRISNVCSVEVSHPYLDRRLVEFLLAIPHQQVFGIAGKPLLRKTMKGILPEKVRKRQNKTSFRPLIEKTLLSKERKTASWLLDAPISQDLGIVSADVLRAEYNQRGVRDFRYRYFFTLELWLRRLLDSAGRMAKTVWQH